MSELYSELTKNPIPIDSGAVTGWKEVPVRSSDEPLVPLGLESDHEEIFTDSIYAGERISSPYGYGELDGSLLTHFTRQTVAEALVHAQDLLPPTNGETMVNPLFTALGRAAVIAPTSNAW